MFFSRTPLNVQRMADLLRGESGEKKPIRTEPRLTVMRAEVINAPLDLPTITDMKDIPDGRYMGFRELNIPERFSETFAFKRTTEKSGNLLVAEDAMMSHLYFEVQRRLRDEGFAALTTQKATREIIKALHHENDTGKDVKQTEIEAVAREIVDDAIAQGASDIHIETKNSFARVYYRIFGERFEQSAIAATTAVEICNVLYGVHGDEDSKSLSWDLKEVKDTVIAHECKDGRDAQLRFSSSPRFPAGNFAAVMRVLVMDEKKAKRVEDIGYTPAQIAAVEEMLTGGHGIVLLVGPTNSGKSSSMQAFVGRIYDMRGMSIKVQTAEDPVEYVLPDAVQSNANNKRKGAGFADLVKGMLRQDPDVTMIGEVRDEDSAENVKDLVLTGRKVITTLHVYEALAAYARLREIGVPESVLFMKGFVSGIISQRLLPKLCQECAVPISDAYANGDVRQATYDRVLRVADLSTDKVCTRGPGCKHCNYKGIIGREMVAEMLIPDDKFLMYMADGDLAAARQHWAHSSPALNIDGNGVTMVAHAIQKMRAGLVSPKDVEVIVGLIVRDGPPASGARSVLLSAADIAPPPTSLPPSLSGRRI